MDKITADMMEIARELVLEVEPKDVAELLQFLNKILIDNCFLWISKESSFLR